MEAFKHFKQALGEFRLIRDLYSCKGRKGGGGAHKKKKKKTKVLRKSVCETVLLIYRYYPTYFLYLFFHFYCIVNLITTLKSIRTFLIREVTLKIWYLMRYRISMRMKGRPWLIKTESLQIPLFIPRVTIKLYRFCYHSGVVRWSWDSTSPMCRRWSKASMN